MNVRPVAVAVLGRGLVDPSEGVIAVDDEGFSRGRAAFETLRVYGGRPFRLDEHLHRLGGSVERLGYAAPDLAELSLLARLVLDDAGLADAVLRLFHTPGPVGAVPVSVRFHTIDTEPPPAPPRARAPQGCSRRRGSSCAAEGRRSPRCA